MSKKYSIGNLLDLLNIEFDKVEDLLTKRAKISLRECLMSGLAIFILKFPSLLQYDNCKDEGVIGKNLRSLFKINNPPSDTYLRERLDVVNPIQLRGAFRTLFRLLQRNKILESFQYYKGSYLVSIDATGCFSSKEISCENCCVKNHRDGTQTFYHQCLSAVMVHPWIKQVVPFAPEIICKSDGGNKNDCERNASNRLLRDLRREHPHLDITVVEDSLYSNAPHINLLQELNMHYIIGAKKTDHKYLYDYISNSKLNHYELIDNLGYTHRFKFINRVPLNESNTDILVNFIDYEEISPKNKIKRFTWVTDFELSKDNVYKLMQGGRARWHIENQTFNTLKNQGYNFEHNFGHGTKNLCNNFINLMFLAFTIDQIQSMGCKVFKKALKKIHGKYSYLFPRISSIFILFMVDSWEMLYAILMGEALVTVNYDTS